MTAGQVAGRTVSAWRISRKGARLAAMPARIWPPREGGPEMSFSGARLWVPSVLPASEMMISEMRFAPGFRAARVAGRVLAALLVGMMTAIMFYFCS